MNKLLLLAFLVSLLALAAAGSQEEEEEEAALTRLAREADPGNNGVRNGKGSCRNKKCQKCPCGSSPSCRKGRKTCRGKSGSRRSGKGIKRVCKDSECNTCPCNRSGCRKGRKACKSKSGSRRSGKAKKKVCKDRNCKKCVCGSSAGCKRNHKACKSKSGSKRSNNGGCNRGVSSTSTCLVNSMMYQNLTRTQIANYLKQYTRMTKANSTGTNKNGKKGLFATTAMRIIKSGGGNKSALACNGNTNSSGAKQLTNVTNTLMMCEVQIKAACDSSNLGSLLPNITEVTTCKTAMTTFVGMVDVCMMITNETAACSCWDNTNFTSLANNTIRGCKHSSANSKVTKQLKYCKGNFSYCKQMEDEGMKAMSSCAQSTTSLMADAAALTANSAGLAAASNTTSSLTGNSTGRHTRAVVTTCAAVVTNIAKILVIVNQMATSTQISTLAATVTGVSVTCTSTEKTLLTTQSASLATAKASVDAQLATVQADLKTATGTTASTAAISAVVSATAAASSRRNIVARHLLNRLNLN